MILSEKMSKTLIVKSAQEDIKLVYRQFSKHSEENVKRLNWAFDILFNEVSKNENQ